MSNGLSGIITIAWKVGVVMVLTFLSQTFTGLNIGLMSLDTAQLKVLIDVPNKDEAAMQAARDARKILPLRQRGNLLLCTILLGNTAVNALMAILLGGFAGGILGWLITTVIIVLMCEIMPQSVCTRHGLRLGALGAPIIRIAMCLFWPITKPYAFVLDRVFPQRENLMDRSQLRSLVEYQKASMPGMLVKGQAEMLIGALGFADKTAEEVMVPLEKAFKLQLDTRMDYELLAQVVQKGFSRFPIIDPVTGQVAGIMHCKDLLNQRLLHTSVANTGGSQVDGTAESDKYTASDFLNAMRDTGQERNVYVCGKSTSLVTLLTEFKRRPHLAVVANTDIPGEADPAAEHIGILTLHNIFEIILQAPVGFQEQATKTARRANIEAGTVRLFDRHGMDMMAEDAEQLGPPEAEAVMSFLIATQPAFGSPYIGDQELLALLRECRPIGPPKRTVLYQRSERTTCGILILTGAVRIVSGEENIESTVGPWTCLGMRALDPPVSLNGQALGGSMGGAESEELLELHDTHNYVPDFTATVLTDGCLLLRIERQRYLKAFLHRTMRA